MPALQDTLVDVCIIGAGFSGLSLLHKARKAGFKVTCLEKTTGIGGTWFVNRYPGARVDVPSTIYQLPDKELWEDFNWNEKYSGREELERYFAHMDKKWELRKDIQFNTEVTGARFDDITHKWTIQCRDGKQIIAQWFVPAVGILSKRFTPEFPGMEKFASAPGKECFHTTAWPKEADSVDFTNKRVGVIGTGASGVQVIENIGPFVKHLTIFQRTPPQTVPMGQRPLTTAEQEEQKASGVYQQTLDACLQTEFGTEIKAIPIRTRDVDAATRRAHYEKIWAIGGPTFYTDIYHDFLVDQFANDETYAFMAEKNRERITDPIKRDLVVPLQAPYGFGTKKPVLEQTFYEVLNQPNTVLIDVSENGSPILEMTESGIVTKDGLVELDVIILATGFDAITGSLKNLNVHGANGFSLVDKWAPGTATNMGISVHQFPNMFFMHGVHSPGALSNSPVNIEGQADWIHRVFTDCRDLGVVRFEATEPAEKKWTQHLLDVWNSTLLPGTKSWYQGSNIPGKKEEPLLYAGGLYAYLGALKKNRDDGYQGFAQLRATSS